MTLATELSTDPLARGYSTMTTTQTLASLETANRVINVTVPVATVKKWALQQTTPGGAYLYPTLLTAYNTPSSGTYPLGVILIESVGLNMPDWDMTDPSVVAFMADAVTAGLLSSTQTAALTAMGQQTVSRAAELGLSLDWGVVNSIRASLGWAV